MTASLLVLFFFGCFAGVTTVLFGFGGGFIIVPVIFWFAGVPETGSQDAGMHVAVATSTAVMIVNSASASIAQWRAGRVRTAYLWPFAAYIALGSLLGATAAMLVPGVVIRVLFVTYLTINILDAIFRKGFLSRTTTEEPLPLSTLTTTLGGTGIGAVASFLGVGGSVMTVPLLRRRGLSMVDSAAMANPLTVPVAVVATIAYAIALPGASDDLGSWHLGYVDLVAGGVLLAGSLPTIAVVRRVAGRIPDRVHAKAYVGLLVASMVSMLVV